MVGDSICNASSIHSMLQGGPGRIQNPVVLDALSTVTIFAVWTQESTPQVSMYGFPPPPHMQAVRFDSITVASGLYFPA